MDTKQEVDNYFTSKGFHSDCRQEHVAPMYDMITTGTIPDNSELDGLIGSYCWTIGDISKMIHYYCRAIEHGDVSSMLNIGRYYESIQDHENTKKYYLMSIETGDNTAYSVVTYYLKGHSDPDLLLGIFLQKMKQDPTIIPAINDYILKKFNDLLPYLPKYIDYMDLPIRKRFFKHYGFSM